MDKDISKIAAMASYKSKYKGESLKVAFSGRAVIDGVFIPRKYLREIACERGHKVVPTITWDTDVLVSDTQAYTSKTEKALDLLVPIVSTQWFLNHLDNLDKVIAP